MGNRGLRDYIVAACLLALSMPLGAGAEGERGAPFGMNELEALIGARGISSVESLLPLLPSEMRSGSVLIHSSSSLQQGDEIEPRVILRSSDARFLIGINGGRMLGAQKLEITEFDDARARFVYHEVDFALPPRDRVRRDEQSCKGCHRQDPRPNWQSWSRHPGTYGSQGDKPSATPGESRKLAAFLATIDNHPRYKYLQDLKRAYSEDASTGLTRGNNNARFTQALMELNARRVARLMRETPDWPALKFAALGSVACDPGHGFDYRKFFPRGSVASEQGFRGFSSPVPNGHHPLLYLFESRGIGADHWSMSFTEPSDGPFRGPAPVEPAFAQAMGDGDAALRAWLPAAIAGAPIDLSGVNCETLAQKSRASLESLRGTPVFARRARSAATRAPASPSKP